MKDVMIISRSKRVNTLLGSYFMSIADVVYLSLTYIWAYCIHLYLCTVNVLYTSLCVLPRKFKDFRKTIEADTSKLSFSKMKIILLLKLPSNWIHQSSQSFCASFCLIKSPFTKWKKDNMNNNLKTIHEIHENKLLSYRERAHRKKTSSKKLIFLICVIYLWINVSQ